MSAQTDRIEHVPSSEEEILAAMVGTETPLSSSIQIVYYDPEWARLFEREAERVRAALGDTIVLLEHVGSTSVPGLAAKPRIDMLLFRDHLRCDESDR